MLTSKEDEEMTDFYTYHGAFCYQTMSFKLKNASAIYQRSVDSLFANQIVRNIEVDVDNMVIKSPNERRVLHDLEETLKSL